MSVWRMETSDDRQSRGSRAHVNKGKPAGTKRPAVTGNDRSQTLQLNNLLLN